MVTSEVEIVNSALNKLGVDNITALSDNNKRAKAANNQYSIIRDECLSSHPWNFAIGRATLAEDASTPAFGFDKQYVLPADVLRVLRLNNEYAVWKKEGNLILTNEAEAQIIYIKQVADVTLFPSYFIEALSSKLAADLSYNIKQSTQVRTQLSQLAEQKMARAKAYDAQEGTPEDLIQDAFLNSRI